MQIRLLAFARHLACGFLRERVWHDLERLSAAGRKRLQHARAFEVVEIVEGGSNARAAHDHAMVREKEDIGIAQRGAHPLALCLIEREPGDGQQERMPPAAGPSSRGMMFV